MKKRKLTIALLSAFLCIPMLGACGKDPGILLKYDNGVAENGMYDTSLFYRNDLNLNHAADPGVIFVPESQHEDGGYFYMYSTTIYNNFIAARSKDLNTWEFLGPVIDWGEGGQWCTKDLWAPEVIYNDPAKTRTGDGKYYLFFSGAYANQINNEEFYIGVAVGDSPAGPFTYYTGSNLMGESLDRSRPTIDRNVDHPALIDEDGTVLSENKSSVPKEYQNRGKHANADSIIDVSPYIDEDGEIYLYLRSQFVYAADSYSHLAVMKMADMVSPLYDSYTQLTYPGYASLEDKANGVVFAPEANSRLDEAPFMIKHDGVYYLTYAPIGYGSRTGYSVSVAVSDNPMGPFVKMAREHGNPALCIDGDQTHMAGPGHHCFVTAGDELFVFYHSLMDRATGNSNPRGIAYDRITFIDGAEYGIPAAEYGITSDTGTFDMLYANGPTWSLQPGLSLATGYKNIAGEAKVTADNAKSDTVRYLNDGLFVSHEYAEHMEYASSKNETTVTLTFDQPREVAAVLIYNSYDFAYAFKYIDRITFELAEKPASLLSGSADTVYIQNLGVNAEYYDVSTRTVRPGSGAVARFDPLSVKKITITVSAHLDTTSEAGTGIKISDIAVIGR